MTEADLKFDAEYGYHFNAMCECLYARIDFFLNAVMLLGGSASAFGAFSKNGSPSEWGGAILAACAAIALLAKPAEKALLHRQAKSSYLKLKGRISAKNLSAIKSELAQLQGDSPNGVSSLAIRAANKTLDSLGYTSGHRKQGVGGWLLGLLML